MPEADETIITRFIVEADTALQNAMNYRSTIDSIKETMRELAQVSKLSFKDIAKGIKESKDQEIAVRKAAVKEATRVEQEGIRAAMEAKREAARQDIQLLSSTAEAKKAIMKEINNEEKRLLAESRENQRAQISALTKENQQFGQATTAALSEVVKEQKEAEKGATGFAGSLGKLGSIASFVFSVVLGTTAIGILRNLVRWFGQAVEAGYEFAKAIYQVSVAIRALQRQGIDIAIKDVYENIDILRDKFGIFTQKELVAGSAQLLMLIRDLGLTSDQIFELQGAIATLAAVNGRAMDDVQRTVALALSSGYTEGLQRLGVSINKVNISQRAMEMGFEGTYLALTEQQRALATHSLIMERTAAFAEDLAEYQKTLAGQVDTANVYIENQKNLIGEKLLPAKTLWSKSLESIVKILSFAFMPIINAVSTGLEAWIEIVNLLHSVLGLLPKALDNILLPNKEFIATVHKSIVEIPILGKAILFVEDALVKLANALGSIKPRESILGDVEVANVDGMQQQLDEVSDAMEDFYDKIDDLIEYEAEEQAKIVLDLQRDLEEIRRKGNDRALELALKFQQDLLEIERKGADRRLELEIEHQQRIEDIRNKAIYALQDLLSRYQLDQSQIWDDYYANVEEAGEDYREREIKREKDYQEKLKRLREEFLFDLEDALRERDARQVLRLVRRYELDKRQAERENQLEAEENKRRYADQLSDLDEQRERRLTRLREEFEHRSRIIQLNRDRELAEEQQRFKREQEELKRNLEIQRREATISYAQELKDLERSLEAQRRERVIRAAQQYADMQSEIQRRLRLIAEGIQDEINLTAKGAQAVYKILYAYYGPNGYVDKLYQYLRERTAGIGIGMPKELFPKGEEETEELETPEFKTGGVMIAKQPTLVKFGEVPEIATFTPLSKIGSIQKQQQQVTGNALIEILLGQDLQARIIDDAMNGIADLVVRTVRQQ